MNEEKVYNFVCENFTEKDIDEILENGVIRGKTAIDIERALKISRNNASTLLNKLVRDKKLIKIETRPVYYLPRSIVENYIGKSGINDVYDIKRFLSEISMTIETPDPFSNLIGYDSSLKYQVEQAKAAILYPPRGLHALITGESGTGKSLFAKMMHKFGLLQCGLNESEYPYVEFNCADYANNPQLLMSRLFGYTQGAFTGADEDRIGLVEKANKGILFLDEVHRLPPEGQEMLFLLMDTNKFYRLGEINNGRQANVLIIAATTENPQRALLRTFIRRIPVLIQMPSFHEKDIEEKVELIKYLFLKEAAMIQREIILRSEVIKQLATKHYPGNIGQLASEVKLLCAQAFMENQNSNERLLISTGIIRNQFPAITTINKSISSEYRKFFKKNHVDIIIKPNNEIDYQFEDEKIYNSLRDHLKIYTESGCTKEQIKKYLSDEIESYYQSMLQRFTRKNMHTDDLYKVINKEIVDFTLEIISYASQKLNVQYSKRCIVGFAFHIKYLLERIGERKSLSTNEIQYIKNEYSKEYKVAIKIVEKIKQKFKHIVCENEKYLITLLLANTENSDSDFSNEVSIIVIAHGDTTASSMANVCNNLLGTEVIFAVDMPLDRSIEDTYKEVIQVVKMIENTKGIIFLVDMGSLKTFGQRVADETGISTKTIENVSTPLLLEIARNAMFKNLSLEEICTNSIGRVTQFSSNMSEKPLAILSVCVSGEGVGKAFKNMIQNELKKSQLDYINVFSFNYMAIKNKAIDVEEILKKYEVIACIGNMNPGLPLPFFHIEKMLSDSGINEIIQCIEKRGSITSSQMSTENENPYKESEIILEKYLTYLNPRIAIQCAADFIKALNLNKIENNRELQISLTIHLAFMLERIILGEKPQFENLDSYIQNNRTLYEKIKNNLPHLTKRLSSVEVSDPDVCYLILAINGN